MNTLRWILGAVIVLVSCGVTLLFIVAGGFRRSFGASENDPLLLVLPLVAAGLLLAALVYPTSRTLLHIAAAAAVALVGICIWQLVTEAALILWWALAFLGLWFVFYVLALRAS